MDHVSGSSVLEIEAEFTSQAAADIVFMEAKEVEVSMSRNLSNQPVKLELLLGLFNLLAMATGLILTNGMYIYAGQSSNPISQLEHPPFGASTEKD
jgi:hypothetical protein